MSPNRDIDLCEGLLGTWTNGSDDNFCTALQNILALIIFIVFLDCLSYFYDKFIRNDTTLNRIFTKVTKDDDSLTYNCW